LLFQQFCDASDLDPAAWKSKKVTSFTQSPECIRPEAKVRKTGFTRAVPFASSTGHVTCPAVSSIPLRACRFLQA
jgi:hypothetical protein